MRNRWVDADADGHSDLLGSCVYASRLLGQDPDLVLHGGGNTSIKLRGIDVYGDEVDVLWVKGSGSDLAHSTAESFSPLNLKLVRRMLSVETMSDTEMRNLLVGAMLDPSAPNPSVEAMVHAAIPDVAVLHTHADAVVTITNTTDGPARIQSIYGDRVVVIPYARPGFRVGVATAEGLKSRLSEETIGIVLMNHGLFTFGSSSREAYDRMIDLVSEAERYIQQHSAPVEADPEEAGAPRIDRVAIASLRAEISRVARSPFILESSSDPESWSFTQDSNVELLASQGPVTPDHVIRTKRIPMFGRAVPAYAADYKRYYEDYKHLVGEPKMLDQAPRVVLDPELGMMTCGPDVRSAKAAGDIYRHTIKVIRDATNLGGYRALPPRDIFELEYWELEQAKLRMGKPASEFTGEIALVTGAASGIGRACAEELLNRGAAVIGIDISSSIAETFDDDAFVGLQCDVTDTDALSDALDAGVQRFGGTDMLVAAAGIFPESAPIADLDPQAWRRAMSVNVDSLAGLLKRVHPLLTQAPRGGRVTVIGSKNVAAPGPGAAAYSASKTAANQLARVAALEWAGDGIRVNSVHPDAVFDTALWTEELLAERAERYGLSVGEYKRRNLMGVEITSFDVAAVVAETLGRSFKCVTGAHIPVDGGSDRVI